MDTETRSIHTFQEGELFDNRYRLVKRAGSGGFADVWKAEDTLRSNKVVALKIYTRLDDEGILEMAKEYDQTEDIQHPNLLTGNHFAAVGNIPYLEMRYCDGGSLNGRVGRMTGDELRHMLRDVCSGLAYLHGEGIVHQDIKPENILLDTKHDRYMLADFGISGRSRSRLSKCAKMASDFIAMTTAYAPPEKFSSNPMDRIPSTKGDIFSLGVTLYELATGNLPVDLPQSTGQLLLISQGQQPLYFDGIKDSQLRHIVQRCMVYRKEDRPTASEVLAMLEAGSGGAGSQEQTAGSGKQKTVKVKLDEKEPPVLPKPSRSQPASKPVARRTWIYVASVVAVLAVLLVFLLPIGKPEPLPSVDSTELALAEPIPGSSMAKVQPESGLAIDKTVQHPLQLTDAVRMDGNTLRFTVDGMEYSYKMIYVSGGSYTMGASDSDEDAFDKEKPQHSVVVNSFYMGRTEVTQALWKAVMKNNPSHWKGTSLPVELVSYNDVEEFIVKLNSITGRNFRLPTEAEWEFAARGGNCSMGYKYSGSDNIDSVAWFDGNSGGKTHPVAQKRANELGLYDMTGNVYEKCSDWYEDYGDAPQSNPNGPFSGSARVCRGGSWAAKTIYCRVSYRSTIGPTKDGRTGIGFRLAL